jgi:hypothetical protein
MDAGFLGQINVCVKKIDDMIDNAIFIDDGIGISISRRIFAIHQNIAYSCFSNQRIHLWICSSR